MVFLLDSNVFIQSANTSYKFCFCQAFWDFLITLHNQGYIYSISQVKDELRTKDDAIKDWIDEKNFPKSFFLDGFEAGNEYSELMTMLKSHVITGKVAQHNYKEDIYTQSAFDEMAGKLPGKIKADGWLITMAKKRDYCIVTQEELSKKTSPQHRIKIPNAAKLFGVKHCIDLFSFLGDVASNNFTLNTTNLTTLQSFGNDKY